MENRKRRCDGRNLHVNFERDKNGIGVFQGRVSTENYGGFASVRYSMKKPKLKRQQCSYETQR